MSSASTSTRERKQTTLQQTSFCQSWHLSSQDPLARCAAVTDVGSELCDPRLMLGATGYCLVSFSAAVDLCLDVQQRIHGQFQTAMIRTETTVGPRQTVRVSPTGCVRRHPRISYTFIAVVDRGHV